MNDYKELVKKLRWATTIGDAPTIGEEFGTIITRKEAMEAANAIEQLVKERDAAVADIKLKPCPFCGDIHPTVLDTIEGDPIIPCFVLCGFCSARIHGQNRHDAVEAWNRRVSDE